ncbi:uncharacterized protein FIBRA_08547 [Fibroporia radiculosa]|uniref:Endopeptidase S2P n=1 Tax=Fibroporia radiculosa TaxID=599839 RepID=J4ICF0_9APHY|nr:uncharacterized protein FIBRA_08547 [Fibroporia radiculosa]CCM06296.1 predicted protein [Fibroporia radiculosa]
MDAWPALALAAFWLAVHVLSRLLAVRPSALPTTHTRTHRRLRGSTQWSLRALHLRVQSTAFNGAHDALTAALARLRVTHVRMHDVLRMFYNVGSVVAIAGMAGALVLMAWTAAQLVGGAEGGQTLSRRDGVRRSAVPVHAIIPGLTVPLAHVPVLLLALLTAQVVHEAGHALVAAIDSVPLLSTGFSLTLVFPSAFVGLSAPATAALPPPARMRLASAGAFHNLVLCAVLAAAAALRTGHALWPLLGYTDVSTWGRVVVGVDQDSPLAAFLPLGAIVTKIDDTLLLAADTETDLWTALLAADPMLQEDDAPMGWCIERSWFVDQPTSCCDARLGASSALLPLACFASYNVPLAMDERCLDPLPYLDDSTAPAPARRCMSAVDCGVHHVCAAVRPDQQLTRLAVHVPTRADSVVVWNGPKHEILRDVDVGAWGARYRLLPVRLPVWVGTFFGYVETLSMSLFFLNLVPLRFLDGAPFLDALADAVLSERSVVGDNDLALEALEGGEGRVRERNWRVTDEAHGRWKLRLQRVLELVFAMLIVSCIVLALVRTSWRT